MTETTPFTLDPTLTAAWVHYQNPSASLIADIVQLSTNYDTGLSETLSGNSQWNNDASDPIKAMLKALDKPLMRPNIIVMRQEVWTALVLNPNTAKRISGNDASGQIITKVALASVLNVQKDAYWPSLYEHGADGKN